MAQRGITLAMVEEAVFTPDSTAKSYGNTIIAFKRFSEGLLKVVYSTLSGDHLIISTIWEERG